MREWPISLLSWIRNLLSAIDRCTKKPKHRNKVDFLPRLEEFEANSLLLLVLLLLLMLLLLFRSSPDTGIAAKDMFRTLVRLLSELEAANTTWIKLQGDFEQVPIPDFVALTAPNNAFSDYWALHKLIRRLVKEQVPKQLALQRWFLKWAFSIETIEILVNIARQSQLHHAIMARQGLVHKGWASAD